MLHFRFVKNTHYVLHRKTGARRWQPLAPRM